MTVAAISCLSRNFFFWMWVRQACWMVRTAWILLALYMHTHIPLEPTVLVELDVRTFMSKCSVMHAEGQHHIVTTFACRQQDEAMIWKSWWFQSLTLRLHLRANSFAATAITATAAYFNILFMWISVLVMSCFFYFAQREWTTLKLAKCVWGSPAHGWTITVESCWVFGWRLESRATLYMQYLVWKLLTCRTWGVLMYTLS